MALGSYDTRRLEGDYSRGLNTQVALRINGAYEEGESFRATPGVKKLSFNPSLLYRFSDRAHLSYEMEILDQELPFDRGVVVLDGKFSQVPVTRFYGEPADGPMKIIARGHQLTFEQQLTANWSLLAGMGYRSSSLEGYSTEPELTPSRQLLFSDGVTLNRQRRYRNFDATDLSGRVELSGKFELLGLPQQLLLGLDNYHYQLNQIQNVWRVTPGDSTYSVNLQQPVYGQPQPALNPFWDLREREQSTGFYLQNQSDLGERWRLMAGFRYDSPDRQFDNFLAATRARQEYHKFTPHLGLVFIAAPQLSIYANYSEGFRPNTGTNWQGEAFAPETSRSYELGAHFNVLDNALKGGLSIFNAEKSNILTADTLNYGYSLALGKAESRGLEVNLEAALAKTWRVVFAYDYVDAQTANDMINPDWGVAIPKGSRLLNIPKHKASVVLQRKFTWRGQPLATGLGAIYVGERLGETVDPDFILPGYTSLRLFANYNLDKKLQLSLVVDNLLNEGYYANSYSALWAQPGNERSLRLGLKGKF